MLAFERCKEETFSAIEEETEQINAMRVSGKDLGAVHT